MCFIKYISDGKILCSMWITKIEMCISIPWVMGIERDLSKISSNLANGVTLKLSFCCDIWHVNMFSISQSLPCLWCNFLKSSLTPKVWLNHSTAKLLTLKIGWYRNSSYSKVRSRLLKQLHFYPCNHWLMLLLWLNDECLNKYFPDC